MSLAIPSNFIWSGVRSSSPEVIISYILPMAECLPTLITTIYPVPVRTLVPDKTIGLGIEWWLKCSIPFFSKSTFLSRHF